MSTPSFKSYRDLEVWQIAMALAKQIYEITAAFPINERFGLVNQLLDQIGKMLRGLHRSLERRTTG
jgi:hypothetical protein